MHHAIYQVAEARPTAYAKLTGDFAPVHTNEAYARTTPFGTRVAPGLFGLRRSEDPGRRPLHARHDPDAEGDAHLGD